MVRAQRGQGLRRLHDRHLRRGAHRARREDQRRHPPVERPGVRGHDRHRRADRAPRHRPLPHADLALRPRAGRPPRRDRAAALRAHPARAWACARSPRCRCAAARWTRTSTRKSWPRCSTRRRSTWPWPTSTRRASRTSRASSTRPACATRTTWPRRSGTRASRRKAVSGETPKRELTRILAAYERGEIDVLVNAQLLAEGWNSPRATVCMHLAPTASRRIYQQRVGRVTRRTPGKEAGIVVDFVHPATPNDDPVITLHSLLDRDVYRGGAIVVGPVRRGRGRRLRVERRVVPVTADEERRAQVFERELWRMAVEHLTWGQQQAWAMLAGARVASNNWRRAKAMLHFDGTGELRRLFLLTCLRRNRNTQLRLRALTEVGQPARPGGVRRGGRDRRRLVARRAPRGREGAAPGARPRSRSAAATRPRAGSGTWPSTAARCTRSTRCSAGPRPSGCSGLLVNSAGAAHARNARRLVQAARKQDRRLSAALLAAALAHTPEAQQVLDGARMRMARKPSALARELLRELPEGQAPPRRPAPAQEGRRRRPRGRPEVGRPASGDAGRDGARDRTTPTDERRDDDAEEPAERGDERPTARSAHRWTSPAARATRRLAGVHEQRAGVVHAAAAVPVAAVPAHRLAAASASRRASGQHLVRARRASVLEPLEQGRQHRSRRARRPRSRSDVAVSRSSAGNSRGRATFSPMPSTAQPSWGRPSTRMPASLRPSTSTSLGHLIAQSAGHAPRTPPRRPRAGASSAARAAPPTSARRARRAPPSAALPPRPAVCSSAVTSVPCGAPAAASALRALVGGVGSRGGGRGACRSSRAAGAPRRRAPGRACRRVAAVDRERERAVGVLVDEQLARAARRRRCGRRWR